jgi:hypothetical protein
VAADLPKSTGLMAQAEAVKGKIPPGLKKAWGLAGSGINAAFTVWFLWSLLSGAKDWMANRKAQQGGAGTNLGQYPEQSMPEGAPGEMPMQQDMMAQRLQRPPMNPWRQ